MSDSDELPNLIDKVLPTELLCAVIAAALDRKSINTGTSLQRLSALRLVSRRWRDAIDHYPALWSTVSVKDGRQPVESALVKSQDCPLAIEYYDDVEGVVPDPIQTWRLDNHDLNSIPTWMEVGESFWQLLNRHRHRWSDVSGTFSCPDMLLSGLLRGGPAPKLRKLSIDACLDAMGPFAPWDPSDGLPFGGDLPMLEDVDIGAWRLPRAFMLRNLRKLVLDYSYLMLSPNDILKILARCPDLSELRVRGQLLPEDSNSAWTGPPVELPKLESIYLVRLRGSDVSQFVGAPFDHILEHIILPPSTSISIIDASLPFATPAMLRWIKRESPHWAARRTFHISFGGAHCYEYEIQLTDDNDNIPTQRESNHPGLIINGSVDEPEGIDRIAWFDSLTHALDARVKESVEIVEVYWDDTLCGDVLDMLVDAFPRATTLRFGHFYPDLVTGLLGRSKTPTSWIFPRMTHLEVMAFSEEDESEMEKALRQVMVARSACPDVRTLREAVVCAVDESGSGYRRAQVV